MVTILASGMGTDEEGDVMEETPMMMIEVHSSEDSTTNVIVVANRLAPTDLSPSGKTQDSLPHESLADSCYGSHTSSNKTKGRLVVNESLDGSTDRRMTLTTSDMPTFTSSDDRGETSIFIENPVAALPADSRNLKNPSPTSSTDSSNKDVKQQPHRQEYFEVENSSSSGSRVLLCFSSPKRSRSDHSHYKKSSESSPLMKRMINIMRRSQEERTSSPDTNHSFQVYGKSISKESVMTNTAASVVNCNSSTNQVNAMISSRESMESKRERKAAKTLAIITGAFVVCWLPFFVTALILPVCGESCYVPDFVMSLFLWLGYINSMINPIIYTIFSVDFRTAFKKILFGAKFKNNRDKNYLRDKKKIVNNNKNPSGGNKRTDV
jgi:hypothetical protein